MNRKTETRYNCTVQKIKLEYKSGAIAERSIAFMCMFWICGRGSGVFSVNLVCKKELNLVLKVSETSSQGAVGYELKRH